MDLGKALGQLGQIFKTFGTAALIQLGSSLEKQLAEELGSLDPRRRKNMGDKWKAELQACVPKPSTTEPSPSAALDTKAVAKIGAAISQAVIEAQPGPALSAFRSAIAAAHWTPLQRFTFLQRVLPDAPLRIDNLQLGNISMAASPAPAEPRSAASSAPPEEAHEAEPSQPSQETRDACDPPV